jgi:hypothetical protein
VLRRPDRIGTVECDQAVQRAAAHLVCSITSQFGAGFVQAFDAALGIDDKYRNWQW